MTSIWLLLLATKIWEQRKLGNLLKVNSGKDYKHLGRGNIPVYGTSGYMLSVNKSLSENDAIGIGRKGTIDKPQFLKSPFWTVDTLFFLTLKHMNDLNFLYYKFQNINWKKYDESTGVPSLTKNTINKIKISIPKLDEQSKVKQLFTFLDNLLALYERKTKLIKQIQSSFLEQFFSEANNVTSLNHFLKIRNGYAFKSSELTENGEMPVVKISNIGNDKPFAFTTETKNKEQFTLYPNDIVIALSGATAGKINQVSNKYPIYYQNQRVGFFERKNDKLDYEYLNSFLHSKKFKSQLQKTLVAGAQPNIASGDIEKIKIPFLEYELQQAIGQVNKDLFRLQNLNKRKLTVLNKIKTTLLNTMFI